MIIRFLLIALIAGLFAWFITQKITSKTQAWSKIGSFVFFCCAVLAVIFPEATNDLAHDVGVGRGADLLLYLLVVFFIAHSMLSYIHRRDSANRMVTLARSVAIADANRDQRNQKIIKNATKQKPRLTKRSS